MSARQEGGATLREPWTTGFGVGAVLVDELHLLVDFKVHRLVGWAFDT